MVNTWDTIIPKTLQSYRIFPGANNSLSHPRLSGWGQDPIRKHRGKTSFYDRRRCKIQSIRNKKWQFTLRMLLSTTGTTADLKLTPPLTITPLFKFRRFSWNNVTTLSNSENSAREARRKFLRFWTPKNAICKGETAKNGSLFGPQKNVSPANFGSGKIENNVTVKKNWRDFGRIWTLRGGFIIKSAVVLHCVH